MFDRLSKLIENYTERRHAGVVTITWDHFANDSLIIEWLNEWSGLFASNSGTTRLTTRIDREAIHHMREAQILEAEAIGYKMPLPLGDFKVGVVTIGTEGAAPCSIRVRDCHGKEEQFVILGNWIQIILPSNDISQVAVTHAPTTHKSKRGRQ
jgi:hypothetical protein